MYIYFLFVLLWVSVFIIHGNADVETVHMTERRFKCLKGDEFLSGQ